MRTRPALSSAPRPVLGIAGIVGDDGEVARALSDQRVDERERHARFAEAADEHGRAVLHIGDRRFEGGESLLIMARISPLDRW